MNRTVLVVVLAVAGAVACGPAHIKPFAPRNRQYTPGKYAVTQADARPATGSLFSQASPGFLQDTRAVRVGDIVIVKIDEQADAKGDASSKLKKGSSREAGMEALLGIMPAIKRANPDVDPAKLLSLVSSSNFEGTGATTRKGQLTANIGVRVRQQMPNGDLYVEGTKVVMINNEEYHLYLSGLVRSADVGPDNIVPSSRMADAQFEFTGRGDVADQVDRGWLAKLLDTVSPF
jgi:flagellar L-ring protein precursor FlgH